MCYFVLTTHPVIVRAELRESQAILIRKLNQLFEFTNELLGSFLWRFHYIPNNKRLKGETLTFACRKMPFFQKRYGFCANCLLQDTVDAMLTKGNRPSFTLSIFFYMQRTCPRLENASDLR